MPKYRNTKTGVVVNIPEALAASIGTYKPVDGPEPKGDTEAKPSRRTRKPE